MMKMSDDKNKTILSQSVGLFIADVKWCMLQGGKVLTDPKDFQIYVTIN
jgi:hypothetical protein